MADQPNLNIFQEYWLDAWQRSILTLDVLRERGNTFVARAAENAPHVLGSAFEVVLDGRTLPPPVNDALVSVTPPEGTVIDPVKPPYVVVDPRAGHGPGIGGMKQESEIGIALAAGHACYFVGFLPRPMPEQTIADVCVAEAAFLEAFARMAGRRVGARRIRRPVPGRDQTHRPPAPAFRGDTPFARTCTEDLT